MIAESLTEAGLPESLAAVANSDSFDVALRASHQRGISLVGADVGTPVIAVPGFYELKRTRTVEPSFD